ncbi:MAG: MG2 domain-containing protein [Janthinobacterium lividum]
MSPWKSFSSRRHRFGAGPFSRLLFALGALSLWGPGAAHGQAAPDSLASIRQLFDRYQARTPAEKLFVHFDRPCYVSGETMWFKLYAVEGTTQQPLAASTVAYVEVLNPAQEPVLQAKIALRDAHGQGSFALPAALATGRYTVRAYTNWMKNFGPEFYFQGPVAILNTRQPLGLPLTRPAVAYDPQFFPEGGYLVQGLVSKVGFKLTDARGQDVAAEVDVLDAAGSRVARFRTLWAGLGSFVLTPTPAGAPYKAVVKLANQQTITCALPPVRKQGYVLHLEEAGPEQLRLVVQAQGPALANERLFLLGHAGQRVVLAAEAPACCGPVTFVVPKRQLAAGVSHFTLFNGQRQPVCERLYFSPPAATLALTAAADHDQYGTRAPVALRLAAAGPLPADLSVAVYQLDSLSAGGGPDITSSLWLAADVKGPVAHPARYFAPGPDAAAAADNLMLTQGWSRFRWADALATRPEAPAHQPELNGHLVQGRVVNRLTGAPVAGVIAYLASPSRHVQLYNSISKADGRVQFEVTDFYGPQQLIAQCGRADSLCRVELFTPFAQPFAGRPAAPLALSERLAAGLLRRHVQAEVAQYYPARHPARYAVPRADSLAFYGKPSEHYLLDKYTRFKVMEEVMREYVPGVLVRIRKDGFHFLVPDYEARETMENPLVLLDGVPVFDTNRIMAFDPLKVQQLDVVTGHYFLGPVMHNGIVSYSTYKGDLADFPLDAHALLQAYEGLQGQREFYAPQYTTPAAAQSRLPDFRNLLYWNPSVLAKPGTNTAATFYTSDQTGTYRVVVQGVTKDGLTGSASFTFEVKAAL